GAERAQQRLELGTGAVARGGAAGEADGAAAGHLPLALAGELEIAGERRERELRVLALAAQLQPIVAEGLRAGEASARILPAQLGVRAQPLRAELEARRAQRDGAERIEEGDRTVDQARERGRRGGAEIARREMIVPEAQDPARADLRPRERDVELGRAEQQAPGFESPLQRADGARAPGRAARVQLAGTAPERAPGAREQQRAIAQASRA